MKLIHWVVRRYRYRSDYEELVQEMAEAFIKAIRQYDPSRGARLSTFAIEVMRGKLRHIFVTEKRMRRNPELKPISIDGTIDGPDSPSMVDVLPAKQHSIEQTAEARTIWERIFNSDRLSDREKTVLRMDSYGFSFDEIGEQIGGCSRQRVFQIYNRAAVKCRRLLNSSQKTG